ncbi:hypothetical protein M422DRAFT_263125 [Sphaerobolus stellatus SS14]|uniref:Uncharacterized protein n=1 Tax=Sphaerobolus stellatus (strain SS14) TaxID=990650 RepID=A0A0C9UZN2_SPHS4|nr:hypothetical protein M422DRAFT_263125 [Sphaerobolus stellatus SS14]
MVSSPIPIPIPIPISLSFEDTQTNLHQMYPYYPNNNMAPYSDDNSEPMSYAQYTQSAIQGFYNQGVVPTAQYFRHLENNGYAVQRQPQYQGASTVQQMHLPQAYANQISLPGPSSSQVKVVNGHQLMLLTQEEKAREGKKAVCFTW